MVVRNEVHVAVASVYWTEDRAQVVDFITPMEQYRFICTRCSRFVYAVENSERELSDKTTEKPMYPNKKNAKKETEPKLRNQTHS
jgi:hypothetical protein